MGTRTPHKEEEPPTHDPATGPALLWKIIIAIINQRFSIGINEDLLNLESGNQTSELQQYKSKPSSLENALKLRYMPSLKLNYSSGAFSRALCTIRKSGQDILGTKHPKFLTHPVLAVRKAWMVRPPTLCAKKETSQAKAPSIAEFSFGIRHNLDII